MGSVRNAEPKTYKVLNILSHYGIDLAILTETKHHGGSYEEEYEVSGTDPENGERNHHEVTLVVKAALWQIGAVSGSLSAIESSLDG